MAATRASPPHLLAREAAPTADITVLVADEFPNFSICGLRYWLGGNVADWRSLLHRTLGVLTAAGLRLRLATAAVAIDAAATRVGVRRAGDGIEEIGYGRLILATGGDPVWP